MPKWQHRVLPWNWSMLAEFCQSQSEGAALKWHDQGQRQSWCWSWSFAGPKEKALTFTSDSDTALRAGTFQYSMFSFFLHLLADQAQQDTHSSLYRAWTVLWRLQRMCEIVREALTEFCFSLFLLFCSFLEWNKSSSGVLCWLRIFDGWFDLDLDDLQKSFCHVVHCLTVP